MTRLIRQSIYQSAAWSLLGTVVPMLAALAAMPFLIRAIGQERLGVLSLIWVIVGYFSFLDMGLGRAVTVAIASRDPDLTAGREDEFYILGTASMLLVGVGSAVAVALGLGIFTLGVPIRLSSPEFFQEVKLALLWMLPSLPLLLLSSALRGYLEGVSAFRALNLLRIPVGVMLIAGPCLAAWYSPHLAWACISILVVRLVHVLVLTVLTANRMECEPIRFVQSLASSRSAAWLQRMLVFGGWVTVSNMVGPVIVYVDRFVIGAVLAATSVAAYAIPFDVVSRLPILIAALCSVLLPELARLSRSSRHQPESIDLMRALVRRSSLLSVAVVTLLTAGCLLVTPWALRVWLGSDFEAESTVVTRILLLAFGVNALAQIPFTALQSTGQVRPVALLHVVELIPYAALLYYSIQWLGVEGAAWACLARSVIDYGVLALMWRRNVHQSYAAAAAHQV